MVVATTRTLAWQEVYRLLLSVYLYFSKLREVIVDIFNIDV